MTGLFYLYHNIKGKFAFKNHKIESAGYAE